MTDKPILQRMSEACKHWVVILGFIVAVPVSVRAVVVELKQITTGLTTVEVTVDDAKEDIIGLIIQNRIVMKSMLKSAQKDYMYQLELLGQDAEFTAEYQMLEMKIDQLQLDIDRLDTGVPDDSHEPS